MSFYKQATLQHVNVVVALLKNIQFLKFLESQKELVI